jgi:hypothetical protein
MRRIVRRIGVTIVGGTLVVLGFLLLALPGPGWVTVAAGLAVLSSEYEWARRLRIRLVAKLGKAAVATTSSWWATVGTLLIGAALIGYGIALLLVDWLPFAGITAAVGCAFGGLLTALSVVAGKALSRVAVTPMSGDDAAPGKLVA